MKKFTILALALCLAVVMAAPVMAVDADFSGYYRVRGVYVQQYDLRDTSENNAFMNMSFRLQTVFKVSDILSVTTRFDALDGYIWGGGNDAATGGADNNLNFDRAYMTINAPLGKFDIGRQAGGTFGTKFLDSASSVDRIKYTKVIDDLTILAIFEKVTEGDSGLASSDDGDVDHDKYCLAAIKKMENVTAGVLGVFYNDKNTGSDANDANESTIKKYALNPYFVSKFGPLAIHGELCYIWGERDYDAAATADLDYKQLAYNVEGSYNLGAATVLAGYAFISGENTDATEVTAYNGVGNDWEKLLILTTNEIPALRDSLGGVGNVSTDGTLEVGAKIIYAGVVVSPVENVSLTFAAGSAKADEKPASYYSDDFGVEYDLTLNWKIYDNLTYTAIAAYLDAGDIFWTTNSTKPPNFDDTYALFHQLQLSF
ncbi:MAG: porin [Desulfobacterales bacterium]|uniref:Porin n=1 Tax=Candidatus Desulfaltia bathyphila TaxID=2841697 RepID=A0A8J6N4U2_9BACT|nr:porin [Candidatus Desulfaltia bathyphila]MBL7207817.1 porin [Desulfobacterales bacterium]